MAFVVINWLVGALVLAQVVLLVWMLLRARRNQEALPPVTPVLVLLTGAALAGLATVNLGEDRSTAGLVLAITQVALVGLATWKLVPILHQHLRDVGLMKKG